MFATEAYSYGDDEYASTGTVLASSSRGDCHCALNPELPTIAIPGFIAENAGQRAIVFNIRENCSLTRIIEGFVVVSIRFRERANRQASNRGMIIGWNLF